MLLRSILVGAAVAGARAPAPPPPTPRRSSRSKPCYVAAQREPARAGSHRRPRLHAVRASSTSSSTTCCSRRIERPTPTADVNGDLTGSVPAPFVDAGQRPFTLRARRAGHPDEHGLDACRRSRALSVAQSPVKAAHHEQPRALPRARVHALLRARMPRSTRTTCSRASRARRCGSACRPATAGCSRCRRQPVPVQEEPAASAPGRSSSIRSRSTTRSAATRAVPLTRHASSRDQAESAARAR